KDPDDQSKALEGNPIVKQAATTGAFISGAVLVERPGAPGGGARLFASVRGDPSVTFFNVADDRDPANVTCTTGPNPRDPFCLDCDGTTDTLHFNRCNNSHRIGVNPGDSPQHLTLPAEPAAIAASEDGEALLVAHQADNEVS